MPGFAVLVLALLTGSGRAVFLYLLIMLVCYLSSMLLIPFIVVGLFEVVVLVCHGMPRIEKSGSRYVLPDE